MKYTEENITALEEAIRTGLSNTKACDSVGICTTSFYAWMEEKADFSDRIKKARANKIESLLETIKKAGEKQWQAAAWILERTEFKDFGNKQKHEIDGNLSIVVDDGCDDSKG